MEQDTAWFNAKEIVQIAVNTRNLIKDFHKQHAVNEQECRVFSQALPSVQPLLSTQLKSANRSYSTTSGLQPY